VRLAASTLAQRLPGINSLSYTDAKAERTRAFLLEAIEALRPPRHFGFGSLESRSYDALVLRYVERRTVQQVMQELHLSRRQVYRGLTEAEAKLVAVVIDGIRAAAATAPSPTSEQPAEALVLELARLGEAKGDVDLADLVGETLSLLDPLARRRNVRIAWAGPRHGVLVLGDRTILKQAVVQMVSCALQVAEGAIRLELRHGDDEAQVALTFAATEPPVAARLADVQHIAASQGGRCSFSVTDLGRCALRLGFPLERPPCLLLVEDNADTVALFRRYLVGGPWQVHSVSDPHQALPTAQRLQPQAIVLDIMLPGMDGWTVIQELKSSPATAAVPLVVCSVVDDPELADALGADAYLKKPVSQEQLLSCLRHLLTGRGHLTGPDSSPEGR